MAGAAGRGQSPCPARRTDAVPETLARGPLLAGPPHTALDRRTPSVKQRSRDRSIPPARPEAAMTVISIHITVAPDGAISTATPLPAGEYKAEVTLHDAPLRRPGKPFTMEDFPVHDGPWDDSISLRREDMYGDDGR